MQMLLLSLSTKKYVIQYLPKAQLKEILSLEVS